MSLLKKNIAANLAGNAWTALMSFALVPFYIHFIGVEAYGIIGFYVVLQALVSRLDLGLTATITRELARLSRCEDESGRRNLARTLEYVVWALAVSIAVLVYILAPWLTTNWLQAESLSVASIERAISMMGIVIALRFLYGFYSGALSGLQHQVVLNALRSVIETFIGVGSVLVLWLVSPSVEVFFIWHAIGNGIAACVLAIVVWHFLPGKRRPKFDLQALKDNLMFSGGAALVALTFAVLMQADKIILSRLLSLEAFGYYSIASSAAIGIMSLVGMPIYSALYPQFVQRLALKDNGGLSNLYHKGSQLMAVIVVPVAVNIALFSKDLLWLWTRNEQVVLNASQFLGVLVLAYACNSLRYMSHGIQLAMGWIKPAIILNVAGIAVLFVALPNLMANHGVVYGMMLILGLNAALCLAGAVILHMRIMRQQFFVWLLQDTGIPVIAAVLASMPFALMTRPDNEFILAGVMLVSGMFSVMAAAFSSPRIRRIAIEALGKNAA